MLRVDVGGVLGHAAQLSAAELLDPLAVEAGDHPLQAGVSEELAQAVRLAVIGQLDLLVAEVEGYLSQASNGVLVQFVQP